MEDRLPGDPMISGLLILTVILTCTGLPTVAEPAPGSHGEGSPSPNDPKVIHADPEESLQTIIDDASPNTHIVGNPNNRRSVGQIEISKDGIRLEKFNLKLANPSDHALLTIHGCRDVTVDNCVLEGRRGESENDGWTNGVTITDAHHIRVVNCRVSNFVLQGITATTNPLHGPMKSKGGGISHIQFVGNRLSQIGNGDLLFAGGKGRTAEHGRMTGNVCTSTTQDVLNVIDGFQHARIRDNVVKGNGVGLAIEQHDRGVDRPVQDLIVNGNVFEHTGGASNAIEFDHPGRFEDITIQNNIFMGGGGTKNPKRYGLHIGEGYRIHGLTVTNNTFENWKEAIFVSGDGKRGVSITGNRIRNVRMGILTRDFAPRVANNEIQGVHTGIRVIAKTRSIRGMSVTVNRIHSTTYGIHLEEMDRRISESIVRHNTVFDRDPSTGTPIRTNTEGHGNVISDNVVMDESAAD